MLRISYFQTFHCGFLIFKSYAGDLFIIKRSAGDILFSKLCWDFLFSQVALGISYFQKSCWGFLIFKSCAWDFFFSSKIAMGISCFQKLLCEFLFLCSLQCSGLNKGEGALLRKMRRAYSYLHIGQPHFGQANLHNEDLIGTGKSIFWDGSYIVSSIREYCIFVVTCHLRVCNSQDIQELSQPKTGVEQLSYNNYIVAVFKVTHLGSNDEGRLRDDQLPRLQVSGGDQVAAEVRRTTNLGQTF